MARLPQYQNAYIGGASKGSFAGPNQGGLDGFVGQAKHTRDARNKVRA